MDWQFFCRIINTFQNTSACKNRHPSSLGSSTRDSRWWVSDRLMCPSHDHGVHVPYRWGRHRHKPGPAMLKGQWRCSCNVGPPWDPQFSAASLLVALTPESPSSTSRRSGWTAIYREHAKKQQLLGAVRSQDWACSRDRRHNNSHDFCCRCYL